MSEPFTIQDYQEAEREVALEEAGRGFKIHAVFYVLVNAVLIAVNLITEPDYLWFFFPLLGWGFGLTMHYVFGVRLLGREIERRQALVERRARRAR